MTSEVRTFLLVGVALGTVFRFLTYRRFVFLTPDPPTPPARHEELQCST